MSFFYQKPEWNLDRRTFFFTRDLGDPGNFITRCLPKPVSEKPCWSIASINRQNVLKSRQRTINTRVMHLARWTAQCLLNYLFYLQYLEAISADQFSLFRFLLVKPWRRCLHHTSDCFSSKNHPFGSVSSESRFRMGKVCFLGPPVSTSLFTWVWLFFLILVLLLIFVLIMNWKLYKEECKWQATILLRREISTLITAATLPPVLTTLILTFNITSGAQDNLGAP